MCDLLFERAFVSCQRLLETALCIVYTYGPDHLLFIYRRIAKTTRRCIKMSSILIRVIFEILLNIIVCFLHFSSSYIQVRVIFEFVVFTGLYGMYLYYFDNIVKKIGNGNDF